jgi:hypothetical protein
LVAGLSWFCCASQPVATDQEITGIKSSVNNIDSNLNELNRSRAMLRTGTDRGGELTIYRRGSDIVRIDATVGGSNSDLQDVFYYSGVNLLFVRTKILTYTYSSKANGFDFRNPRVKQAADYYVREGELIPIHHTNVAPPVTSRLLQEAQLFLTASRRGDQVVDIEKILK